MAADEHHTISGDDWKRSLIAARIRHLRPNKLGIDFDELAKTEGLRRQKLSPGCTQAHEHSLFDEKAPDQSTTFTKRFT